MDKKLEKMKHIRNEDIVVFNVKNMFLKKEVLPKIEFLNTLFILIKEQKIAKLDEVLFLHKRIIQLAKISETIISNLKKTNKYKFLESLIYSKKLIKKEKIKKGYHLFIIHNDQIKIIIKAFIAINYYLKDFKKTRYKEFWIDIKEKYINELNNIYFEIIELLKTKFEKKELKKYKIIFNDLSKL